MILDRKYTRYILHTYVSLMHTCNYSVTIIKSTPCSGYSLASYFEVAIANAQ